MNREKNLFKNTLILSIGNICTKLITFFLLPLYTAVLSTEEYGIVDLLNTLVSLFLPIVTFQIEQAVFRSLLDVRENDDKKKELITTSFLTVIFQCVGYLFVFIFLSFFVHNDYKWFLLINLLLYIFSSLFQQVARGVGDNTTYAISGFISAIFTIIFNILFIVSLNYGAYGMLAGTAIGQMVCIIYIVLKLNLYKFIDYRYYNKKKLKELWKYSVPLIPNSISWWIFNASDRLIVTFFLGLSANGILAAAHKFSSVYITFYNVFHLSWLENISVHIDDDDIEEYYNKMMNVATNFFIALAIGIIAFMPIIYSIMVDSNYYEGYYQIPIIMVGSVFNVLVALETAIYVAKKNTKAIASTSIVSAIINIISHLLLIRCLGLFAATLSTLLAYFIMFIYRYIDIRKKYIKLKFNIKVLISSMVVLIIIIPIYYYGNVILQMAGMLISIIYAFFINKNSIDFIKRIIKRKIGEKVESDFFCSKKQK